MGEGSAACCANAVTVDVSHSGCMAVVGGGLAAARKCAWFIQKLAAKRKPKVVWRDHEAWDVGLELVKPDASFLGTEIYSSCKGACKKLLAV